MTRRGITALFIGVLLPAILLSFTPPEILASRPMRFFYGASLGVIGFLQGLIAGLWSASHFFTNRVLKVVIKDLISTNVVLPGPRFEEFKQKI